MMAPTSLCALMTHEFMRAYDPSYPLTYVRSRHAGRAVTRNTGIDQARGDLIIFCDSDRAVDNYYIARHLQRHGQRDDLIIVGSIWEFYFSSLQSKRQLLIDDLPYNLQHFQRQARMPIYPKVVGHMFDGQAVTRYAMPWIAFFSGNVSVRRAHLQSAGAFDPQFVEWGFEHFELGYRLYQAGLAFAHEVAARNYHFAHRRDDQFYQQSIRSSFSYFVRKHPVREVQLLDEFLHGRLSLQQYHNAICAARGLMPVDEEPALYYRQLGSSQ
jgi:glycosyltransferase involved in cell wall biosynthesis